MDPVTTMICLLWNPQLQLRRQGCCGWQCIVFLALMKMETSVLRDEEDGAAQKKDADQAEYGDSNSPWQWKEHQKLALS